MKLLTHNMLTSKCLKGVTVGYPLGIIVSLFHKETIFERLKTINFEMLRLTLHALVNFTLKTDFYLLLKIIYDIIIKHS